MVTWQTHFTKGQLELIDSSKHYQRHVPTSGELDPFIIIAKLVNILEEGVVPPGESKSLLAKAVVIPRPDSSKPTMPNKPASFA